MEEKYWIWLARLPQMGGIRLQKLLEQYETPERIWRLTKEEIRKVEGIGEKLASNILEESYRENLESYSNYMKKENIQILTIQSKDYPENLKRIYGAPVALFYKGNKELLKEKGMAMVGCRDCSLYGRKVAQQFAEELTKEGFCIISGLAKGIDTFSHIGCLRAKRKNNCCFGKWIR